MWSLIEKIINLILLVIIMTVFLLILTSTTACERTVASKTTRLPVSRIVDSSRAEQREVLESRGIPDGVWSRQLGVTVWMYCNHASVPELIEFGSDGWILAKWHSTDEQYCQ
ncbi:MAG: hypothetical protein GY847_05050 [Proteobacteria bacterium]|nr:hypothetical protein [Pseudomonadota bacterium]